MVLSYALASTPPKLLGQDSLQKSFSDLITNQPWTTHIFKKTEVLMAKLTVVDDTGLETTAYKEITVYPKPESVMELQVTIESSLLLYLSRVKASIETVSFLIDCF